MQDKALFGLSVAATPAVAAPRHPGPGQHVVTIQAERGPVSLTQFQLDYILDVADGGVLTEQPDKPGQSGQRGSTAHSVRNKIAVATGWTARDGRKMQPTQMLCRFAVVYGLVGWGRAWLVYRNGLAVVAASGVVDPVASPGSALRPPFGRQVQQ